MQSARFSCGVLFIVMSRCFVYSDGAAALVLVSGAYAKAHSLTVLAVVRGFDDAAQVSGALMVVPSVSGLLCCCPQSPELFTTAPALAVPKVRRRALAGYVLCGASRAAAIVAQALARAGWSADKVDLCELNEAFAVVGLANTKLLGLSGDIVNVNGGAFVPCS